MSFSGKEDSQSVGVHLDMWQSDRQSLVLGTRNMDLMDIVQYCLQSLVKLLFKSLIFQQKIIKSLQNLSYRKKKKTKQSKSFGVL